MTEVIEVVQIQAMEEEIGIGRGFLWGKYYIYSNSKPKYPNATAIKAVLPTFFRPSQFGLGFSLPIVAGIISL